ncbi:FAD synthase [Mycoplasma sp. AC1221]
MDKLIIYTLDDFKAEDGDSFIIGSFQSFHLGHYQLYKQIANNPGRKIIVTFSCNDIYKYRNEKLYQNDNDRYLMMSKMNVDAIIELHFNDVRHLSGPEFLHKLASDKKVNIAVGQDFKFGYQAQWKADDIANILPNANVCVVEIYKIKNVKISTKLLREGLAYGKFRFLNMVSPFGYLVSGELNNKGFHYPENVIVIPAGLYIAILYANDFGFHIIMHKTKDNSIFLKLVEKQSMYSIERIVGNVVLEIISELRFIVSNDEDQITEEDYVNAKNIFLKS